MRVVQDLEVIDPSTVLARVTPEKLALAEQARAQLSRDGHSLEANLAALTRALTSPVPGQMNGQEIEFTPFPKIARLRREIIVTEKIDGTNAAVGITDTGVVYAQSRKRIITPEQDNAGFARWVKEHEDELREQLGIGLHFGEWWGSGIQRGYGVEKRFSLFNVTRWEDLTSTCCYVVPVIARANTFDTAIVKDAISSLRLAGSYAAPGFMSPEGVVVYHPQSNSLFKQTIEKDDSGKGHEA